MEKETPTPAAKPNCAQQVLLYGCEKMGLDPSVADFAAGFGSGMCWGATCGAVSGAVMSIGVKCARDPALTAETRLKVRAFMQAFEDEFGALTCEELLGSNISEPAAHEKAMQDGTIPSHCPRYIDFSKKYLEENL